jgi:hypothetical protein
MCMDNYFVRALVPHGISDKSNHFLQKEMTSSDGDSMPFVHLMAQILMEPFSKCSLPFGSVMIGWAQNIFIEELENIFLKAWGLTNFLEDHKVTAEGVMDNIDSGRIAILYLYPLTDIEDSRIEGQNMIVSFFHNKKRSNSSSTVIFVINSNIS